MNPELQKIEKYIASLGFSPKTFADLSKSKGGKALVIDRNMAFCFDNISDYFYKQKLGSADALLLKNSLYLIEFKSVIPQLATQDKKNEKLLKLNLSKKMIESFHTLRECIFVNSDVNPDEFEKHFILVTEDAVQAISAGYRRKSGAASGDIFKNSFEKYQQKYKNAPKSNRIRVYYDSVDIWAVSEFPKRVAHLK